MVGLIGSGRLDLHTRQRSRIDNYLDINPPTPGMVQQVDAFKKQYVGATHRSVGPCRSYNCHGLTFAARRTSITDPNAVQMILNEDDYEQVNDDEVCAGDIAVYYVAGDAEHSGIVVERDKFGVRILSKWGGAHEVIHRVGECDYDTSDVRYYRVRK